MYENYVHVPIIVQISMAMWQSDVMKCVSSCCKKKYLIQNKSANIYMCACDILSS